MRLIGCLGRSCARTPEPFYGLAFAFVESRCEVAVFVTRREDAEVLLLHRSPDDGTYWHVVAGAIDAGEAA